MGLVTTKSPVKPQSGFWIEIGSRDNDGCLRMNVKIQSVKRQPVKLLVIRKKSRIDRVEFLSGSKLHIHGIMKSARSPDLAKFRNHMFVAEMLFRRRDGLVNWERREKG